MKAELAAQAQELLGPLLARSGYGTEAVHPNKFSNDDDGLVPR